MNILSFDRQWKTNIVFCMVDNTKNYDPDIRTLIKNQADGVLANVYNKGYKVLQWNNEEQLLAAAADTACDYAVVFSTGTEFINGQDFFNHLESLITKDFFIAGHILDRGDAYYELHHQCYVVNLKLYRELGRPVIGSQQFCSSHKQWTPWRSKENYHDNYTPIWVSSGEETNLYQHKCHGWNILGLAFEQDLTVLVFDQKIRDSKIYMYPESPKDFYKQLGWAYHRLNYCKNQFVHTSNTETIDLPIKKYQQIVTPASGTWFLDYTADECQLVIYDYNQSSLDYWSNHVPRINGITYKFVLCDLLGNDNLVDHINLEIDDTLINLSNIFNYEGTSFFYSLEYRKYKQQTLLNTIPESMQIYFSIPASLFDTVPTWHIN